MWRSLCNRSLGVARREGGAVVEWRALYLYRQCKLVFARLIGTGRNPSEQVVQ